MGRISTANLILESTKNENQKTTGREVSKKEATKTANNPRKEIPKKTSQTTKEKNDINANSPKPPTKGNNQNNTPSRATPPRRDTPGTTMPREPEGIPGEKRINLPLWAELWRKLSTARIDDGIDTTTRIRAMIELWDHDPRLRRRIDQLAKTRAASIHRGRPRTR